MAGLLPNPRSLLLSLLLFATAANVGLVEVSTVSAGNLPENEDICDAFEQVNASSFTVAAGTVVEFDEPTAINADIVTIEGVLQTKNDPVDGASPDGPGLCIRTEQLTVASSAVVRTAKGLDQPPLFASGVTNVGLGGGNGGGLLVLIRDEASTPASPAVSILPGGRLVSGGGGLGQKITFLPGNINTDLDKTVCGNVEDPPLQGLEFFGGNGGDAGDLLLDFESGTAQSISAASLHVGRGGDGGAAIVVVAEDWISDPDVVPTAVSGGGGSSRAFLGASLLGTSESAWLADSQGGNGGLASVMSCLTAHQFCQSQNGGVPNIYPNCIAPYIAQILQPPVTFNCPDPNNPLTCGMVVGSPGTPDTTIGRRGSDGDKGADGQDARWREHSLLIDCDPVEYATPGDDGEDGDDGNQPFAARAKAGGFGMLAGGKGGDAKAYGADGGAGGVGGRGGIGYFGSGDDCFVLECGEGGDGGAGGDSSESKAEGGDGGDALLGRGGDGGAAFASRGRGGSGGNGGPGGSHQFWGELVPPPTVCAGGCGGLGGETTQAEANGGDGGAGLLGSGRPGDHSTAGPEEGTTALSGLPAPEVRLDCPS